jgi:hypothetical protein
MRLLANVILTISLTIGALSAASAYLASLSLPAEQLVGLTLNAPAGVLVENGVIVRGDDGVPLPAFERDHTLTDADVQLLKGQADLEVAVDGRQRQVGRVLVKSFSFGRWEGKWLFLLSLAGLGVGAFLVKSATRREIETAEAARADGATPEEALEAIISTINGLARDLPTLPSDHARCEAIVEMIGRAERDHVPVFIDARTLLVSRLGLAGYAALMDRFAAMERQINRAWSAAADEHYPEAATCIEKAQLIAEETRERMSPGA